MVLYYKEQNTTIYRVKVGGRGGVSFPWAGVFPQHTLSTHPHIPLPPLPLLFSSECFHPSHSLLIGYALLKSSLPCELLLFFLSLSFSPSLYVLARSLRTSLLRHAAAALLSELIVTPSNRRLDGAFLVSSLDTG